jgi:hypothetical protein
MNSNSAFKINWEVVDKTESFSKRFNLRAYNSKIKCDYSIGSDDISIEQIFIQFEITINSIIHRLLRGAKDDDRVRISLRNHALDFDIYVPFRKVSNFTTESLLNEIIKVSQSRREFLLYGYIEVDVIHVRTETIGGGRRSKDLL